MEWAAASEDVFHELGMIDNLFWIEEKL